LIGGTSEGLGPELPFVGEVGCKPAVKERLAMELPDDAWMGTACFPNLVRRFSTLV
jgi:hypothetical protein